MIDSFISNLLLAAGLVLIGAGIFLSWRLRLFQIRSWLFSFKVLSGAMDWGPTSAHITHFTAALLGRGFAISVISLLAMKMALLLYGPAIWPWLVISVFLIMPLDYVVNSLEHQNFDSSRSQWSKTAIDEHDYQGDIVSRAFQMPILSLIFRLLSLFAITIRSIWLPAILLLQFADQIAPGFQLTFICLTGALVLVLASSSILRQAIVSKWLALLALIIFLLGLGLDWSTLDKSLLAANLSGLPGLFGTDATLPLWPRNLEQWILLLISMGSFWTIVGAADPQTARLVKSIRTPNANHTGLGIMATSGLFVFVPLLVAYSWPNFFAFGFSSTGFYLPQNGTLPIWFQASLGLLAITALQGAIQSGNAIFRSLFPFNGRGFFWLLTMVALVATALQAVYQTEQDLYEVLYILIAVSVIPLLISVIAALRLSTPAFRLMQHWQSERKSQYEITKDILVLLFHLLPKNTLSRLFGLLSYIHLPHFLRGPIITTFARAYRIDLDEAHGEIRDYPSLNRFFTRALREGVRVVANEKNVLVSPVDGRMSQFGAIQDGILIQAKGLQYSVDDLLVNSEFASRFQTGSFCVLYLSPQDYHRIHSPDAGRILGYSYHPGQLFPVNQLMVNGLSALFPKNERLSTFIETSQGLVAVIKVGATNVGRISLSYDSIRSNRWFRSERHHLYHEDLLIARGAELGRFEMGSTVILLIENPRFNFLKESHSGLRVRYGQIIGAFAK
ncbi:MAG: phosphatidylserine decarboxylase [Leptospiraceae bacterium]|nr:phosphatidylserine decarboxylase [Leptospiraceae bacterium]